MKIGTPFHRPLKDAGSRAIEDAITKAICELTGEDYEVNVHNIDFGNTGLSSTNDIVNITLTASKAFKGFGTSSSTEDTASPA